MIRLKTFSLEHAQTIIALYKEIVGGRLSILPPDKLVREIGNGEAFYDGYRVGSKWDPHSKLRFSKENGFLRISFNENFDPKDRTDDNPLYQEALVAKAEFEKRANELT